MTDQQLEKARTMARALLEDPAVRVSIQQRLIDGDLPEQVEVLLWELAFGGHFSLTSPPRRSTRPQRTLTAVTLELPRRSMPDDPTKGAHAS
jgi:hypothetical protein